MLKAERYVSANLYTRRITFGGVTYRPALAGLERVSSESED